ncbi:MAG: hypothetical protein QF879_11305 [Candidatus Latescibacteria bacterium]|nr:hypothetical protein [Candidatus Latescibacterota bacterium]
MQEHAATVPIIVLTGLDDGESALEAIPCGVQDCLVEDQFNPGMITRGIGTCIERKRLEINQALSIRHLQDALAQIKTHAGYDAHLLFLQND